MLLTEYLSGLANVIDEYSRTGLIIDSELSADCRTEKIGIIKGSVTFADNSILVFTEYLDLKYKIEKLNYSFHYKKKMALSYSAMIMPDISRRLTLMDINTCLMEKYLPQSLPH